tara:strand:- start:2456 stop:2623 length:168 start_codon:yes stop_codon:yes gene_type:complete
MKIVIKTKYNDDLCDIDIDETGVITSSDCTIEDIDMNDDMVMTRNVNYLEVRLIN